MTYSLILLLFLHLSSTFLLYFQSSMVSPSLSFTPSLSLSLVYHYSFSLLLHFPSSLPSSKAVVSLLLLHLFPFFFYSPSHTSCSFILLPFFIRGGNSSGGPEIDLSDCKSVPQSNTRQYISGRGD